jgi:hypothetical protein
MTSAVAIFQAWNSVATLLVLRVLPVFVFLLISSKTNFEQKMAALVSAIVVGALTRGWTLIPWTWYGLSYLYFIALGCLVPIAARWLRRGRLSRGSVFVLCFSAFLLLPGFLWPSPMKLVALVFAWDIVLSSYSYCVEISRSSDEPSRADCLFFLLVNPALVYSQRGARVGPASFERVGLWRVFLALVVFFLTWLLLMPFLSLAKQKAASNGLSGFGYADLILCGALAFAIQYVQASALASLQIGLLRQTGHLIPERYDWPIRAKTLPDFWRRWNIYVSQWTLHYLFWPFSLQLGRRFRDRRSRVMGSIAALIAAFAVVGLLHDAYASLLALVGQYRLTAVFVANGALVVLWLGVERIGQRALDEGRVPRWIVPFAGTLSRVCLWCFVSICAAFWFGT